MSTINTNGINANYPIPGTNNSSQGFRDNFAAIKTNLDTAGNEITDLQNKVVLKAALSGTTLNNDMANALISNASILGFRTTPYNLGSALAGTVAIDASLADVHYGTVAANVSLQLQGWATSGSQRSIEIQFNISNANAVIMFPSQVVANNNNYGATLIENGNVYTTGNVSYLMITPPAETTQLNYILTSNDCGNTVYIEPINRPYKSTQVQQRSPSPTGLPGDKLGAVAADSEYLYVCVGDFSANTITMNVTQTQASGNVVTIANVSSPGITADMPIIFSGNVFGNIVVGETYFVGNVIDSTHITISETRPSGAEFMVTDASGSCSATVYDGANIWTRTALTSW